MFGAIKRVDNNEIIVENLSHKTASNLMNCHLILEEEARKIVGEVIFIDNEIIKVLLVGEIIDNKFTAGIIKKPSATCTIRVITYGELELLLGKNALSKDTLYLGKSAVYNNFNVTVPLNNFFAAHSAIVGNTGSGKSCCVSRLFQNLFLLNPEKPINAHVVLFDAYGEYVNTFDQLVNNGMNFKVYNTSVGGGIGTLLNFPAYFLDADDLALLLQVDSSAQLPVLEKALKLVKIFKSNSDQVKQYKNNIIANTLQDILTSGRSSTQIRDQIIAVLTHYNTETLNLNSRIHQVGYDRTLQQCLLIDNQGKMASIFDVVTFLQQFDRVSLEDIQTDDFLVYNLEDIYYALEFALVSEGNLTSDVAFQQNNILKSRLQSIINSEKNQLFKADSFISKESYVVNMFHNTQVIDINLGNLDDRFAKVITKLYSKLFFKYTITNYIRSDLSINIVLEEAHRYVQNDTDIDVLGYNIFDRITKEGRKYGTLLTFITQRPSELSETALSQCSNFIVFRIYHPRDLDIIKNMSTNISPSTIEQIKLLNPGVGMAFGTGFNIPTLIKFDLPNPLPRSTNIKVNELWYKQGQQ